jgi:hypothetical protein
MTYRLATATLTATLALAFASDRNADASTVQSYSYTTTGSISGMAGVQPIEFYGLFGNGTLSAASPFALGQFITNPLPATATLTYNHTPFTIDLNVVASPGSALPNYDYKITGQLNGSINGVGQSSMKASISSITGNDYGTGVAPPFPISELKIIAPSLVAAPNGYNNGFTTLNAELAIPGFPLPTPAPEPSSIAAFGVALTLWGLRRRARSKTKV